MEKHNFACAAVFHAGKNADRAGKTRLYLDQKKKKGVREI